MKTNLPFNLVALFFVVNIVLIATEFFMGLPIIGSLHLLFGAFMMHFFVADKKK